MLQNHHDTEEATQESLIRVATNLSSFRGDSWFSTWSWAIATRCIIDYKKGLASRATLSAEIFGTDLANGMQAVSQDNPETSAYLSQVKIGCSRAMLQVLDGDHRLVHVLSEILGLDQAEAAKVLGITFSTYRKRLSRARSQLQSILRQNCGIFDTANERRCAKRRDWAIELGRLEPEDATDLDIDSLSRALWSLDELGKVVEFFQADTVMNASERLIPRVREVLNMTWNTTHCKNADTRVSAKRVCFFTYNDFAFHFKPDFRQLNENYRKGSTSARNMAKMTVCFLGILNNFPSKLFTILTHKADGHRS